MLQKPYDPTPDLPEARGFPSPARDFRENPLNLNDLLIQNKVATYFIEVETPAFQTEGIHIGDILIVDRSLKPQAGDKIIVAYEGEICLRKFLKNEKKYVLPSSSSDPVGIDVPHSQAELWGVVTYIIHKAR